MQLGKENYFRKCVSRQTYERKNEEGDEKLFVNTSWTF